MSAERAETGQQPPRRATRSQWRLQQPDTLREPSSPVLTNQLDSIVQQISLLSTAVLKMDIAFGELRLDIKALPHVLRDEAGIEEGASSGASDESSKCLVAPLGRPLPTDIATHRPSPAEVSSDKRWQSAKLGNGKADLSPMGATRGLEGDLAPLSFPQCVSQSGCMTHPNSMAKGRSNPLKSDISAEAGKAHSHRVIQTASKRSITPETNQGRALARDQDSAGVSDDDKAQCGSQVPHEQQGACVASGLLPTEQTEVNETSAVSNGKGSQSLAVSPQSLAVPCKRRIQKVLRSPAFDFCCVMLIFINTAWMGYQVEWLADNMTAEVPREFSNIQSCFSVVFFVEVLLRLAGCGVNFFTDDDAGWNVFDLMITAFSVLEIILLSVSTDTDTMKNVSFLRVLRILRIVRIVRIIRVFRFFRELRMMVYSVLNCIRSLLWAICLIFAINYISAIFFTQVVTDYRVTGQLDTLLASELEQYFAHLYLAMYYQFLCVSGGISWGEVADPLIQLDWSYGVVMCLLIAFTVFAVLNIVTAVFVENAMQTAHMDGDNVSQLLAEKDKLAESTLRKIFKASDTDESGTIDYEEFQTICAGASARAKFHQLGLELPKLKNLFRLLDMDNSGAVSAEEFVEGCLRLRGGARNVDLAALMHENKRLMKKWSHFMGFVKQELMRLSDFEEIMLGMRDGGVLPEADKTQGVEHRPHVLQARTHDVSSYVSVQSSLS